MSDLEAWWKIIAYDDEDEEVFEEPLELEVDTEIANIARSVIDVFEDEDVDSLEVIYDSKMRNKALVERLYEEIRQRIKRVTIRLEEENEKDLIYMAKIDSTGGSGALRVCSSQAPNLRL